MMPETDLHIAGMVAERLRRSIAGEPFAVHKGTKRIEVTISIGLTTLEQKGEAVADVLKRADTALYRAKHDGRNRVCRRRRRREDVGELLTLSRRPGEGRDSITPGRGCGASR